MAKAMSKTNAMRILEREKIPYREHTYSHDDGAIDGISVAEKMGQDPGQVFKTLITRSSHGGIYVFVIPVAKELDLKAAARAAGVKSIAMIHVSEILEITGYILSLIHISWTRVLWRARRITLTASATLVSRYRPSGIMPRSAATVETTDCSMVSCSVRYC